MHPHDIQNDAYDNKTIRELRQTDVLFVCCVFVVFVSTSKTSTDGQLDEIWFNQILAWRKLV